MWAGISDSQLIKQSALIIEATFIGSSTIILNKEKLQLGALSVKTTFKGNKQELVFIKLSLSPEGYPRSSNKIRFQVGQKGLWFLENNNSYEGIYEIKLPQGFIPEQQLKNRLPALLKLLN